MTTLPPAMVAALEQLGVGLVTWAQAHRDASLAEHEQGVLAAVRAVLPTLLGLVVERSTTALDPTQPRQRVSCVGCARRLRVRRWRGRQVQTLCGALTYQRPEYHCPACGQSCRPADATLGVAPRARLSAELAVAIARLGAATVFAEAQALLETLTGLRVSAETVRQHSEAQGQALQAAAEAACAQVQATREAATPPQVPPGPLVVETDGVLVRYQDGWHEVKLGVVGGWQDGRLQQPSYVAQRTTAEAFGPHLLMEAARRGALEIIGWEGGVTGRGLAVLPPVVVLGDGAAWIWSLAADHFGRRTEIVDYYHASEHLWTVARALHAPKPTAAATWAATHTALLREQGAAGVLAAWPTLPDGPAEQREVLRRERGYFRTNQERMAYPTFRAHGLPIGSGAVESAAKHLVQQRFKRPGMRWSPNGAQALLALRAHLHSGRTLAA